MKFIQEQLDSMRGFIYSYSQLFKGYIIMEFKTVCGFEFVKIGEAYLNDKPLEAKYNGKPVEDWRLKLRLVVTENILDAEELAYLVFNNKELLYVGYYSNSFRERWWIKNGYFWHGDILDNKVNELIRKDDK